MSVNGVNGNSNNNFNAALYASLIGGTAAAGVGYATKSILKDGNYTDEFIHEVTQKSLNSKEGKCIVDLCKLDKNSATYAEDIVNFFKKHGRNALGLSEEEFAQIRNIDAKTLKKSVKLNTVSLYLDKEFTKLSKQAGEEIKHGKDTNIIEILKKQTLKDIDEVFDRSKNAFKPELKESNIMLKFVKKAQKSLKLKAAATYGIIAAGVIGLGAMLFGAKKS